VVCCRHQTDLQGVFGVNLADVAQEPRFFVHLQEDFVELKQRPILVKGSKQSNGALVATENCAQVMVFKALHFRLTDLISSVHCLLQKFFDLWLRDNVTGL